MEQTLERFVRAQKDMYETARQELLNKKRKATGCGISFRSCMGLVIVLQLYITVSKMQKKPGHILRIRCWASGFVN